jgi:trimeric autotransporter adhesin
MENMEQRLATLESALDQQRRLAGRELSGMKRRLGVTWTCAFIGTLAAFVLGFSPDARAQFGVTLTGLHNRLTAVETKTQFISIGDGQMYVTGTNLHLRSGLGATNGNPADRFNLAASSVNGLGNLIIGYNEASGTYGDERTGSHNLVFGDHHDYTSFGGLVAGQANRISNAYATVTGGYRNVSSGALSSVSGGQNNTASGVTASVGGGDINTASGFCASIGGGQNNTANNDYTSVMGGRSSRASGLAASVTGGNGNEARGAFASVTGGYNNDASGDYASISGGNTNAAQGIATSISGGQQNRASVDSASVSGGLGNDAGGVYSAVSGGVNRDISSGGQYDWKAGSLFQDF